MQATPTIKWKLEKSGSDWWPSVYGAFVSNGDQLLRSTREGVFAFDRNSGKQLWDMKAKPGSMAGSNKGVIHEGILYAPTTVISLPAGASTAKCSGTAVSESAIPHRSPP